MDRKVFMEKYGIHEDYYDFFNLELIVEINRIIEIVKKERYAPEEQNIFKALTTSINDAKVVIIGQDPYFQLNAATGLAFEVGNLTSWDVKFKQRSLQNIVRNIYESYNNKRETFSVIRNEIISKHFNLQEPNILFKSWQRQGVILLNSYFTVKIDGGGNTGTSHKSLWEIFFCRLIKFISEKNGNLIYFLWGNHAQNYKKYIVNGIIYESNHPSMAFGKEQQDFLNFEGFKKTKEIIEWIGN